MPEAPAPEFIERWALAIAIASPFVAAAALLVATWLRRIGP